MTGKLQSFWALPVLFVLASASLGACAARDYRPPASAFYEATKTAQASLASYEEALDRAAVETNITYVLEHRSSLRAASDDCRLGSAHCRLVVRASGANEYLLVPGPIDPNIRALMASVVAYGAGLDSIAQANVESDVRAATEQARSNGVSLARAVDSLAKAMDRADPGLTKTAEAFGAPVADAVLYAAGRYVEALKLDALRRATKVGSEIFPVLSEIFGAIAEQGMSIKRSYLYDAYIKADTDYNVEGATRARLDALRTAAHAFDASLSTDPRAVFMALADAHNALANALKAPEPSFASLWPQLQRLAEEATKLNEIAKALRNAASTPATAAAQ